MNSASAYTCLNRAWRTHKAEIRGFLNHRVADTADADDLLQDVFFEAGAPETHTGIEEPRTDAAVHADGPRPP